MITAAVVVAANNAPSSGAPALWFGIMMLLIFPYVIMASTTVKMKDYRLGQNIFKWSTVAYLTLGVIMIHGSYWILK